MALGVSGGLRGRQGAQQVKLFHLLRNIFTKDENNNYIIHPDLTLNKIIQYESDIRDIKVNLYTTCEKYYIQALLIFEEIYETEVRTNNMNENKNENESMNNINLLNLNNYLCINIKLIIYIEIYLNILYTLL